MYCACISILTYTLLRRINNYVGVLICVYDPNCIAIISNICDHQGRQTGGLGGGSQPSLNFGGGGGRG